MYNKTKSQLRLKCRLQESPPAYGDEMYRKVSVGGLCNFDHSELRKPYGKRGETIESSLRSFEKRGFNGVDALGEALAEMERRMREDRSKAARSAAPTDHEARNKILS